MSEPDRPLPHRRTALTAAQMSASYPAYDAGASEPPRRGFFATHRFAVIVSAGTLAFLLLATGAVFAGYSAGASKDPGPQSAGGADAAGTPRSAPDPLPAAVNLRTCSIGQIAVDPKLGTVHGSVVNVPGSEALFARAADDSTQVGSALGAVTATAAITLLGADYQLSTQVVDSNVPGTIVLVGGGDSTLSRVPTGQQSVYENAPKLADLAQQTISAYEAAHPGIPITEVVLDANYWDAADSWNNTWDRSLQTGGNASEVTALQVDGDRDDPTAQTSPRSTDPIARAGAEFTLALTAVLAGTGGAISVREGSAENGAPVLGEVKSAPIGTLVGQMLATNDATLAESLARVVSVKANLSGSAASLQQAIPQALQQQGLDTRDITIRDGSGISADNAVSTSFLAQLFVKIASEADLAPVLEGMPVAGEPGALETRIAGDAVPAGAVSAVSGSLNGLRSIAGFVTAADGTQLAFAFVAVGDGVTEDATSALDALVAGVYGCGNNLSNT